MTADPDSQDLPHLAAILEHARRAGFVGPRPVVEQIDHASALAAVLEAHGSGPAPFLDLGSGGGLPGLILAARWPEHPATLLDASARRTAFLRRTVVALGWEQRVEVAEGRAEVLGKDPALRGRFPLVVARSFARPAVTAEIGGAFVQVGGVLAVSEPDDAPEGAAGGRWPAEALEMLGFAPATMHSGAGARVAILFRMSPLDARWPRAVGVPTKRPLW
ncbi:MAG: rRNA (guanine527-N7)-methyltransferase [Actinomycetota bacterium]|nr:rRNA (guanine527-N7)-methyltransferase [Actinomycetota bacterium]